MSVELERRLCVTSERLEPSSWCARRFNARRRHQTKGQTGALSVAPQNHLSACGRQTISKCDRVGSLRDAVECCYSNCCDSELSAVSFPVQQSKQRPASPRRGQPIFAALALVSLCFLAQLNVVQAEQHKSNRSLDTLKSDPNQLLNQLKHHSAQVQTTSVSLGQPQVGPNANSKPLQASQQVGPSPTLAPLRAPFFAKQAALQFRLGRVSSD